MRPRPVQRALRADNPEVAEVEAGILEYFTKRVVPKNRKRPNLRLGEHVAAGDESKDETSSGYARSLLLGLFTVRGCGVSRACRAHGELLRLCHRLAELRPRAFQFQYLAIMVNDNPCVPYHRDINNSGLSFLRTMGDYTVGRFHQCEDLSLVGQTPSLSETSGHGAGCSLDSHHSWVVFDAQVPHAISQVDGRRLSLAYFVPVRHEQISAEVRSELRQLGFPLGLSLPTTESFPHPVPCLLKDSLKGSDADEDPAVVENGVKAAGGSAHAGPHPLRRPQRKKKIGVLSVFLVLVQLPALKVLPGWLL
eukprot:2122717-Amphidinium_carterae.1